MIVLLNGAFGVGKTTVAEALTHHIPETMIFDPEEIGSALRRILTPIDPVKDFQDYSLWRSLVVTTASLLRSQYERDLIVPMTIWRRDYFREVIDGFHAADDNVWYFRLTAPEPTLRARIIGRPESVGPHGWALDHLDRAIQNFADPFFGAEVATEDRTADEIALEIVAIVGARASRNLG